jgi:hypothetical protein
VLEGNYNTFMIGQILVYLTMLFEVTVLGLCSEE